MKAFINSFISFIAFVLMFFGGCGVMDEYGNIQPAALIMTAIGTCIFFIQSRRIV